MTNTINYHNRPSDKPVEFKRHLETRVIHGGQAPEPATGAVMPPIFATGS